MSISRHIHNLERSITTDIEFNKLLEGAGLLQDWLLTASKLKVGIYTELELAPEIGISLAGTDIAEFITIAVDAIDEHSLFLVRIIEAGLKTTYIYQQFIESLKKLNSIVKITSEACEYAKNVDVRNYTPSKLVKLAPLTIYNFTYLNQIYYVSLKFDNENNLSIMETCFDKNGVSYSEFSIICHDQIIDFTDFDYATGIGENIDINTTLALPCSLVVLKVLALYSNSCQEDLHLEEVVEHKIEKGVVIKHGKKMQSGKKKVTEKTITIHLTPKSKNQLTDYLAKIGGSTRSILKKGKCIYIKAIWPVREHYRRLRNGEIHLFSARTSKRKKPLLEFDGDISIRIAV